MKIALIAVTFLLCALPGRGDELKIVSTPAPVGQQRDWNVDGMTVTSDELLRLFAGLEKALDKNDTSIHVSLQTKKAGEMPAFDRTWHCAGVVVQPDNTPTIAVWVADDSVRDVATVKLAIEACIFAGLAETGYGGRTWKALYDRFAAEDAALGANAPDPNRNRRRFALQLAHFYDLATSGKLTASPSPSVAPSPAPSASSPATASSPAPTSTPTKETLHLDIPQGWVRTESGRYNEWRGPDGSNFRVAPMPFMPALHGARATDAVKQFIEKGVVKFNPYAQITVLAMKVCNGEQTGYRVNDPLGMGSAGFIVVIPGPTSTGLINYEARGAVDPEILETIAKICWP